ncbi:MAG: hypothetical protein KF784_00545 [Fimbriimonadaceae bacterium]|nr:hypothetical protein [Fimbriimonadaceae bacterium]
MHIALGLDCGGSSCRAMAQNESDEVVFQGQSGPANIATTPPAKLRASLEKALAGCPTPDTVCGCFAGLLTAKDRQQAIKTLREIFPAATIRAEPDYYAALMACVPGTDICVIAGTGSLICSRHNDTVVKSGGKGYLLGDWGSAYRYGKAALEHYLERPDQASAALVAAIEDRFQSREQNEIIARLYRGGAPAPALAKLVDAFVKDARAGEAYATQELKTQTKRLVEAVKQHKDQYLQGQERILVCLSGGLWDASGIFREAFDVECQRSMPDIIIETQRIQRAPVYGAIALAKEI